MAGSGSRESLSFEPTPAGNRFSNVPPTSAVGPMSIRFPLFRVSGRVLHSGTVQYKGSCLILWGNFPASLRCRTWPLTASLNILEDDKFLAKKPAHHLAESVLVGTTVLSSSLHLGVRGGTFPECSGERWWLSALSEALYSSKISLLLNSQSLVCSAPCCN